MRWLLDTSVIVDVLRQRAAAVAHLHAVSPDDLALPSVVLAELAHGARCSADPVRGDRLWRSFAEPYEVVPFDRVAAETHAELRFALRGQPIGERHQLIAATARAHGYGVITNNRREFMRVPGLSVVDWSA